jgi:hypothetical protein
MSRSLLPANPPLFSRRLQLPIPIRMDLRLTPGEHVLCRDVANRAVRPNIVVMLGVALYRNNPSGPFSPVTALPKNIFSNPPNYIPPISHPPIPRVSRTRPLN